MKTLTIHYKSEVMQKRWEQAVAYLRSTKTGWILDKKVEKK